MRGVKHKFRKNGSRIFCGGLLKQSIQKKTQWKIAARRSSGGVARRPAALPVGGDSTSAGNPHILVMTKLLDKPFRPFVARRRANRARRASELW